MKTFKEFLQEGDELEKVKATVYYVGSNGLVAYEANKVAFGFKDYAQYKNQPFVKFSEKGKQKVSIFRGDNNTWMVVVPGWNHPAPEQSNVGNAGIKSGTPEAQGDELIKSLNVKPLFDARHTQGTDKP